MRQASWKGPAPTTIKKDTAKVGSVQLAVQLAVQLHCQLPWLQKVEPQGP